jgi:cytidylate kinase
MRVITISRLVGSGGAEVAGLVASAMGFRLVTKETLEAVFGKYGFVEFQRFYEGTGGFWDRFGDKQEDSLDFLGLVMRSLAREGSLVILGRASFIFLGEYADVLNVRLWAPLDSRVARVMERTGIAGRREAERRVTHDDQQRARFLHLCARGREADPGAFDLAINTAKVPLQAAAALVAETARGGGQGSPTTLDIPAEEILDKVTEEALFQRAR